MYTRLALSTDGFLNLDASTPDPASSVSSEWVCFLVCLLAALADLLLSALALNGPDPIDACGVGLFALVVVHIVHSVSILGWGFALRYRLPYRTWLQVAYGVAGFVLAIVAAALTAQAPANCATAPLPITSAGWVNFAVDMVVAAAIGAQCWYSALKPVKP